MCRSLLPSFLGCLIKFFFFFLKTRRARLAGCNSGLAFSFDGACIGVWICVADGGHKINTSNDTPYFIGDIRAHTHTQKKDPHSSLAYKVFHSSLFNYSPFSAVHKEEELSPLRSAPTMLSLTYFQKHFFLLSLPLRRVSHFSAADSALVLYALLSITSSRPLSSNNAHLSSPTRFHSKKIFFQPISPLLSQFVRFPPIRLSLPL